MNIPSWVVGLLVIVIVFLILFILEAMFLIDIIPGWPCMDWPC